ncbi:MAG: hypothetical protein IJY82_03085 [Oscillospiraceae bacterium]|nr:hypothetical protein [Oscillospiraceae bacterium]
MQKEKMNAGVFVADITPQLPVRLSGQLYKRIAREVYSPLKATVLVLRNSEDHAIFIGCDLVGIPAPLLKALRERISAKNCEINPQKIILSATHIHTGPYIYEDDFANFWGKDFRFDSQIDGVATPSYADFLLETLCSAILATWESCQPVTFRVGNDYCPIAFPRRVVYNNGSAKMYGSTAQSDFSHMEGSTDFGIHFISVFNQRDQLLCAIMNLPCPAQILEHKHFITSDYWDVVREAVKDKYGAQAAVLPLIGAAGDLSPRDLVRLARDEAEMHKTAMYNPEGTRIVSNRIMHCFDAFMASEDSKSEAPDFAHLSAAPLLPIWQTTREEAEEAQKSYDTLRSKHQLIDDFTEEECMYLSFHQGIINRYRNQQKSTSHSVEIHCIKLGDTLIATNPFELFVAYADRIRAQTNFPNVIVAQLACAYDGYLPTREAVLHGGYSACISNGILGPEGGDRFVEETLKLARAL